MNAIFFDVYFLHFKSKNYWEFYYYFKNRI